MSFNTLTLSKELVKRAENEGFKKPTPIQEKAIPLVLQANDVIGLAQTGTGKTAAFILPILQKIKNLPQNGKTKALVLAPTRELAEQIQECAKQLGRKYVSSTAIYGGVNINQQIRTLKKGVDLVIACPGRLLDHINRRTIDLSQVQILTLDEADQMLDMGFFKDIKKIVAVLPKKRQTLLFSATMPKEIEQLSKSIQNHPKKVEVDKREVTKQVKHSLFVIKPDRKTELLTQILGEDKSAYTLVFARTKYRAMRLAKQLTRLGLKATSLHGNLSIGQRRRAVESFKSGKSNIMVATDVAARGLDITNISHVINYDLPSTPELYIHRIGRTGRAKGTGVAYSFMSSNEKKSVQQIERAIKQKLPMEKHQFN